MASSVVSTSVCPSVDHEFQADGGLVKACANCGATQDLLRCSRCHQAWFCGPACQRAYWPFHKSVCQRNDFADAIEATEPKFAGWMRRHGKLAVLKDDEVERLERASSAGRTSSGATREQVMQSMYGRADPKPLAPAYTAEDLKKMRAANEAEEERKMLRGSGGGGAAGDPSAAAFAAIEVNPGALGLDCGRYKWTQTQSHVEVFLHLPPFTPSKVVAVEMTAHSLRVSVRGEAILEGKLAKEINCKRDGSTWFIRDARVLEISMLKRYRRGLAYEKGGSNADTFWRSVFQGAGEKETLQTAHPPTRYYETEWRVETDGEEGSRSSRKAAKHQRTPLLKASRK